MPVSIHWIIGQLRAGNDYRHYGDPYESCATVTRIDNTAYISGWVGPVSEREAIADLLRAQGCTEVAWERKKNGRTRWARFSLVKEAHLEQEAKRAIRFSARTFGPPPDETASR